MRRPLLLVLLLAAGCTRQPPTPPTPADDSPAAKVGRPAPPFAAVQWLHGEPVLGFQPGTVYALDFWASWCGPCVQSMPHVQQVADEFAGRAVVIGATAVDDRNPLPAVQKVLESTKAGRHGVRHAVIDAATLDAYAVNSYPKAVVVGADGRVAYVGHPLHLAEVLDRVLAGTWQGRTSAADLDGKSEELGRIFAGAARRPAEALAELAKFEQGSPSQAGRAAYRVSKVGVLVAAGRHDEAKPPTEELLPLLTQRKDVRHLANLRAIWADPQANPERKHANLAVRAAEALVAIEGDTDPAAVLGLADAHLFAGDKGKGRELADKAVSLAPDGSPVRKWLTEQRKRFE